MPTSKHWRNLDREIATLRSQFLPKSFDPLGQYPESGKVQAYTRAFLVLSHAEIETFLESWAKEIARSCEEKWISSNKLTLPLGYLIASRLEKITTPHFDTPSQLSNATTKLFQSYYKAIKDNHGIKELNILELFSPFGVPASVLSTTLLANLDALGNLRGAHAHNSAKAVQVQLDPETEHKTISSVVRDLKVFDDWLVAFKKRIR